MAAEKVDITPSKDRIKTSFAFMWRGMVGGAISGLGMALLGVQAGSIAGGLIGGSIIGGDAGKIIALHAGYEAVELIFTGNGGQ